MKFLLATWRRIGTKLYFSLALAVLLTLVSGFVAIYYFEQSGDATYQARTLFVPAANAAKEAARQGEALNSLAGPAETGELDSQRIETLLDDIDGQLSQSLTLDAISDQALQSQHAAYRTAEAVERLNAIGKLEVEALRELENILQTSSLNEEAMKTVGDLAEARTVEEMEARWTQLQEIPGLDQKAIDTASAAFQQRGHFLSLQQEKTAALQETEDATSELTLKMAALAAAAESHAEENLERSVSLFDRGRVLLASISIASVTLACAAAWLLVANGLVRPLERLSDRMRGMAAGDIETPVPDVGTDEIGELAGALEHFRTQALEVERLNLVEKLYGELQEANDELQRMQDRLIAQEKLAALGELVSGVAHEISNPLNFVQNFSEVSIEMHEELSEVLAPYLSGMSEEDRDTVEDIKAEMGDSLTRIRNNGGRVLAIVERMRTLGFTGGEAVVVDLNESVRQAVQVAVEAFLSQNSGMDLQLNLLLEDGAGSVEVVEHDLGEALVNMVNNACQSMREKQEEAQNGYVPVLEVTTASDGREATIIIKDNGVGIRDEIMTHIFNPFFSTHDGVLGAGLGLPIAADVARRSGGAITVESSAGEYAAFTMTLPTTGAPVPD